METSERENEIIEVNDVVCLLRQKPLPVDFSYRTCGVLHRLPSGLEIAEKRQQRPDVVIRNLIAACDYAVLDERLIVVCIVEREVIVIPEVVYVALQKPESEGVEGRGRQVFQRFSEEAAYSLSHLVRGLVGEGEGQYVLFIYSLFKHVGDPVGYHAGFS